MFSDAALVAQFVCESPQSGKKEGAEMNAERRRLAQVLRAWGARAAHKIGKAGTEGLGLPMTLNESYTESANNLENELVDCGRVVVCLAMITQLHIIHVEGQTVVES